MLNNLKHPTSYSLIIFFTTIPLFVSIVRKYIPVDNWLIFNELSFVVNISLPSADDNFASFSVVRRTLCHAFGDGFLVQIGEVANELIDLYEIWADWNQSEIDAISKLIASRIDVPSKDY